MFLILNTDNLDDVTVVQNDPLIEGDGCTKYFEEYDDAQDYGDRNLVDYLIVEVDI